MQKRNNFRRHIFFLFDMEDNIKSMDEYQMMEKLDSLDCAGKQTNKQTNIECMAGPYSDQDKSVKVVKLPWKQPKAP